ncbi:hypothetical protein ACJMK2_008612 [Sinanodonta woodiana]|uniref:XK-related protein n=1 Tax=Sinanodonta woodiana TaxID=1069815 RepID=A0ABD3VPR3_SINWO
MTSKTSDRSDMIETEHFPIPFTNYNEDAETTPVYSLTVPKDWEEFYESGSFDYRFQSGDTTHDDINAVLRSGHPEITMRRQNSLNTSHPNISRQTEHPKEYDPMRPVLDVLPELYDQINIQNDPTVCYAIDGKNDTCAKESFLPGCSKVSNEVQNPLENMEGEAITDQESQRPIFNLGHDNDQVTSETESNTMDLTVTDWTKVAMQGPMLRSSDLYLFTRRKTFDQLDSLIQLRNNQVPRPRSYHGPELSNTPSSVSSMSIGSDQRKGYVRICRSSEFINLTSSNRNLTSSKLSDRSSKLETPEDGQDQNQHEEYQLRSTLNMCTSITFAIISILLFFADWATDIILAHKYLIEKEFNLFGVTVAFIIGPALVCAATDLYWFYHDHLNSRSDRCSQCVLHSEVQNKNSQDTHFSDMRISSDDMSVYSQHNTINFHDKHIYSQDNIPECPDTRCQMKIHTSDFIAKHHSGCFRSSNVWVGFRIFVGILSMGRVFRSCEYIYHVIKSSQNGSNAIYHHLRALEEKRDYKLLDLIYASTESAPQFFLQLYLVFMFNKSLETEKVLSMVASVVGISWTVVSSYTQNKAALPEGRQLTLAAQVLIFLARLCEISARILSIVLFEVYFKFWSLLIIFHFIIMLLWIQEQNPSLEGVAYSKHFRVLFKLFFSYVLVICFINFKCNRSKYRMVFYYVLTYGENFLFAGFVLWKVLKSWKTEGCEQEDHNRHYWLAVIPICFILHLMFQILFYLCCYRNRRS